MRPINKTTYTQNQAIYHPYGDAKPDLIDAIDEYCSYCERKGFSSALDVEHIEDKSTHPHKETHWDNFLLACKNCNSIKGTKQIDFSNIILPHLHDTYHPFDYLESGLIMVKQNHPLRNEATELLLLVGLDRMPGHQEYSTKDTRWQERMKAYNLSQRYLKKYQNQECDIETIIDLAKETGFWSIWMNTFSTFLDVQQALVLKFKGTNQQFVP